MSQLIFIIKVQYSLSLHLPQLYQKTAALLNWTLDIITLAWIISKRKMLLCYGVAADAEDQGVNYTPWITFPLCQANSFAGFSSIIYGESTTKMITNFLTIMRCKISSFTCLAFHRKLIWQRKIVLNCGVITCIIKCKGRWIANQTL